MLAEEKGQQGAFPTSLSYRLSPQHVVVLLPGKIAASNPGFEGTMET